jgi:hypothetical protein
MGSKVDISEAAATAYAKARGLRVTTTGTTGTLKQLVVGYTLVQYDTRWGGCACWRVGSEPRSGGYKGEAVARAAAVQLGLTYSDFVREAKAAV